MLKISLKGSRRTNLIYKCNLSIKQLKKYLNLLLDKGLLQKSIVKKNSSYEVYTTTKKGKHFLKKHRELKELITG
jgi:predicted transcriptional regulator